MGSSLTVEFEALLKRSFGLDAASIGSSAIERAVRQRAQRCGFDDLGLYWQHLQGAPAELQELIEAVVVPETWFLRDRESFAALGQIAIERQRRAGGVLRLLSLPCSTGEEPYSMAITLLEAGVAASQFTIDAVDISSQSLAQARRAEYGRNAFRGGELAFRERYFSAVGDERWRLDDAVRRPVRYRQGNLLDAELLQGEPPYDIVFCRNVLIYFDRATQQRALAALERLLAPEGVLFVGPSETALLLRHEFQSLKLPLAFAFRRASAPAVAAAHVAVARKKAAPPPAPPRRAAPAPRPAPASRPSAPPPPAKPDALAEATRLADSGQLDEAKRLCSEVLRTQPASADAQHLLGLIHDAQGDAARAADCYRKALYLDPKHQEALLHLAFLLEKRGELGAAQRLQQRAGRLQPPRKPRAAS
ncbi:CheR family methyltransferase [Caldimonas sp. KR1-144]|uniref:CheR family methyltransferase n=1 Tax=Caldimonas sp. KR1-144 TaxID=3400911 RepID=UPI003BFF3B71